MHFSANKRTAIVGLTALWDWLDLGHMGGGKDYLVLDRKEFDRNIKCPDNYPNLWALNY